MVRVVDRVVLRRVLVRAKRRVVLVDDVDVLRVVLSGVLGGGGAGLQQLLKSMESRAATSHGVVAHTTLSLPILKVDPATTAPHVLSSTLLVPQVGIGGSLQQRI